MEYRADLHCHSICSDGTYTPMELLALAHEKKLSALSITDHDTLEAYSPALFAEAKKLLISLFVGAEFSARYCNDNVHILGYGMEKTPEILAFCRRHYERRVTRNQKILSLLTAHSFPISEEELLTENTGKVIGRPHIANIMVAKGYVRTVQEAFNRFLGEGRCCFDFGPIITVEETIAAIHKAKGKAFIAHPHLLPRSSLAEELLSFDFDGIECYYALLPFWREKKWIDFAKKRGKLISGGSDFHGTAKPHISLGCSWVGKKEVESIFGSS